jgi:hypothetical protein
MAHAFETLNQAASALLVETCGTRGSMRALLRPRPGGEQIAIKSLRVLIYIVHGR